MSDEIKEWTDLKCPECGVSDLMPLVKVRYKQGAGTNTQPSGFKCSGCMTNFDTAYIVQRADMADRRRKAQAAMEELDELEKAAPVKKGKALIP